ncbi:FadR/GntR family transcriptional regulator [Herbaspirillum sp. B65]|uniref:FadR/GntR family transcriptional regulator n=1 Tax=Herbaspirillum sp. B65 TaxID=137708 RepID=UPI000344CFBC|nr:GntR family transcriptional regulator [Herbaspirillum sp. B65]
MTARIPAYRLAQAQIKRFIEERGLTLGDALPPEGMLAEELGMSRPSLREAVKSLESLGILESRHGEGIYVKGFSFDTILDNLPYAFAVDGKQLRELLQVRAAIETGAAPAILQHMSAAQLKTLRQQADHMLVLARSGEDVGAEDRQFQATLYGCLDNAFLSTLTDLLWRMFHRMGEARLALDGRLAEATARDRIQLAKMIEAKDLEGLLQACEKHFQRLLAQLEVSPAQPGDKPGKAGKRVASASSGQQQN